MYELIVSPLVQYSLSAVGLAMCLYLFLSLKMELRGLHKRAVANAAGGSTEAGVEARITEIGNRVEEALARTWNLPERKAAITYTKRTQALRMHRRGESASTIAGALAVPRNEIDLLLKVQNLVQER